MLPYWCLAFFHFLWSCTVRSADSDVGSTVGFFLFVVTVYIVDFVVVSISTTV